MTGIHLRVFKSFDDLGAIYAKNLINTSEMRILSSFTSKKYSDQKKEIQDCLLDVLEEIATQHNFTKIFVLPRESFKTSYFKEKGYVSYSDELYYENSRNFLSLDLKRIQEVN